MPDIPENIHTASLVIKASVPQIYASFLDPNAVAQWRPPAGMNCIVHRFEPYEGGDFRMSFVYNDPRHNVPGKSDADTDTFHGRFMELIAPHRIVELIHFESEDPAFAEPMLITTSMKEVEGGTLVSFLCERVPSAIREADHKAGMESSLRNLATYLEKH